MSAFDDALISWEEVGEPYSKNLKRMTLLDGIVHVSYSALSDILMENDTNIYTYCILELRKKAIHT